MVLCRGRMVMVRIRDEDFMDWFCSVVALAKVANNAPLFDLFI